MRYFLAALFFFAILTLWVPALWPVTVFETGIFTLAAIHLVRARRPPPLSWPLLALAFATLWGLFQWLAGLALYPFETKSAILYWTTLLAVFCIGSSLFSDAHTRRWFRSAMLWFAFLVSVLATLQTFTSGGLVFWLFPAGYPGIIMGPVLNRNHYAAFIEAVLPFALYESLRREEGSLLYSAMAASMYASVIASASRAGTILATVEIVVVVTLLWSRGATAARTVGLSFLRIFILFAAFTAVVGWDSVWNRFWAPDPMALRREFAISTLHMISAHPFAGIGLGSWSTAYPHYAIADFGVFANQAHCDWLQWAAEGGIPLAAALLLLFLSALRPALRTVWGLGVIFVFLHATVDYPFSRPALAAWPILILSMLFASGQDENSPQRRRGAE